MQQLNFTQDVSLQLGGTQLLLIPHQLHSILFSLLLAHKPILHTSQTSFWHNSPVLQPHLSNSLGIILQTVSFPKVLLIDFLMAKKFKMTRADKNLEKVTIVAYGIPEGGGLKLPPRPQSDAGVPKC